jgi:hypothetical protein
MPASLRGQTCRHAPLKYINTNAHTGPTPAETDDKNIKNIKYQWGDGRRKRGWGGGRETGDIDSFSRSLPRVGRWGAEVEQAQGEEPTEVQQMAQALNVEGGGGRRGKAGGGPGLAAEDCRDITPPCPKEVEMLLLESSDDASDLLAQHLHGQSNGREDDSAVASEVSRTGAESEVLRDSRELLGEAFLY